ncbi:PilW family protein [Pseudomonas sp. TE3610]
MRKHSAGLGLIELMVAMLLGVIILLGVTQIFVSAKNTYLAQNASAAMQEDARYALSRMLQEIRMVGMFGCVNTVTPDATATDWVASVLYPINFVSATNTLTLVTGDVGANGTTPTWTILTDCLTTSTVSAGAKTAATGQIALPIRRVIYTYNATTKQLLTTTGTTQSVLLNNVSAITLLFGMAADTSLSTPITSYNATPATTSLGMVRSVRISLTLTDPNGRVKDQVFSAVAGIRNRLP